MVDDPKIDYSQIDYPSGQITLKQIRSRGVSLEEEGQTFEFMHMYEQEFANLGFVRRLGNAEATTRAIEQIIELADLDAPFEPEVEQREYQAAADRLADFYVRFGVASGPESARELVRRLEAQGAQQAADLGPRQG